MEQKTLEISHLSVSFSSWRGTFTPVNDVSLEVRAGEIVGLVGESGCGKSMTARAVMGLIRAPGKVTGGRITLCGKDLLGLSEKEMSRLRGAELSMVFQDPMTSLNPVVPVGRQVEETILLHRQVSREEARKQAAEIFEEVGIPEAEKRIRCYPHELSGGLRQRVMIAMAMVCRPRLLIADEPTTALDVIVEAQILQLMRRMRDQGTSILFISHNLGAVAQLCDYACVMYAGQIVEQAEICTLFDHPAHPYTRGLLGAVASLHRRGETLDTIRGSVPALNRLPAGCSFAPRCDLCDERCMWETPAMTSAGAGHPVRCFHAGEEVPV